MRKRQRKKFEKKIFQQFERNVHEHCFILKKSIHKLCIELKSYIKSCPDMNDNIGTYHSMQDGIECSKFENHFKEKN